MVGARRHPDGYEQFRSPQTGLLPQTITELERLRAALREAAGLQIGITCGG
jgi:hypothetical protein